MGLRVYLKDNDGKTHFIDYGLDSSNYQAIIKTEIREESSKIKTYSGSKYVGIPEIDNPPKIKPNKKSKNKIPDYEIFDSDTHDTDTEYYWVSAICSNCNGTTQVAILKNDKVDKRGFRNLVCPKCLCVKTIHHAKWDGIKYVRIKN